MFPKQILQNSHKTVTIVTGHSLPTEPRWLDRSEGEFQWHGRIRIQNDIIYIYIYIYYVVYGWYYESWYVAWPCLFLNMSGRKTPGGPGPTGFTCAAGQLAGVRVPKGLVKRICITLPSKTRILSGLGSWGPCGEIIDINAQIGQSDTKGPSCIISGLAWRMHIRFCQSVSEIHPKSLKLENH